MTTRRKFIAGVGAVAVVGFGVTTSKADPLDKPQNVGELPSILVAIRKEHIYHDLTTGCLRFRQKNGFNPTAIHLSAKDYKAYLSIVDKSTPSWGWTKDFFLAPGMKIPVKERVEMDVGMAKLYYIPKEVWTR